MAGVHSEGPSGAAALHLPERRDEPAPFSRHDGGRRTARRDAPMRDPIPLAPTAAWARMSCSICRRCAPMPGRCAAGRRTPTTWFRKRCCAPSNSRTAISRAQSSGPGCLPSCAATSTTTAAGETVNGPEMLIAFPLCPAARRRRNGICAIGRCWQRWTLCRSIVGKPWSWSRCWGKAILPPPRSLAATSARSKAASVAPEDSCGVSSTLISEDRQVVCATMLSGKEEEWHP